MRWTGYQRDTSGESVVIRIQDITDAVMIVSNEAVSNSSVGPRADAPIRPRHLEVATVWLKRLGYTVAFRSIRVSRVTGPQIRECHGSPRPVANLRKKSQNRQKTAENVILSQSTSVFDLPRRSHDLPTQLPHLTATPLPSPLMLIAHTIGIRTGFIYEGENYRELGETTHCDEGKSAPKELL
jgi:hypothetical protein